jgi:transcriptional regulator GlxA family with amidase domain
MDRVHTLLQMGDPSRDTVADIAMRYGFWELGRFAGVYRARYGETPSATLRGRKGQRLH